MDWEIKLEIVCDLDNTWNVPKILKIKPQKILLETKCFKRAICALYSRLEKNTRVI